MISMLKKIYNKVFSSRGFYVLISLLVSFVLWMYVEININSEEWYSLSNVSITYKNEELLRDKGLLISSVGTQNLTLNFLVSRTVFARLTNGPVKAEVDLSNISSTGLFYQPYEIILPPGISIDGDKMNGSVGKIGFNIDRLRTVPIDVSVVYSGGTASEDLMAMPAVFEPRSIMVHGPEDIVSKISGARVRVNREKLSETYVGDLGFVLLDDGGEEYDNDILSTVTLSDDTIHVTIPIRQTKRITLDVLFSHNAGTTDQNVTYEIIPPFIEVSGDPEDLKELNTLILRTISTTTNRFKTMDWVTFDDCRIALPNAELINETNIETATVRVKVNGLEVRDYETKNLTYINCPAGYRVEWTTTQQTVSIRGSAELLNQITSENIRGVVDLRDRTAGAMRLDCIYKVDGISSDVGAVGEYQVSLKLIVDTGEDEP